MGVKVEELLEQVIVNQLEALDNADEYTVSVEDVVRLMEKKNEMERIEQDRLDKEASRKIEEDLKLKELAENKKHRLWNNAITIGTCLLYTGVTIWANIDSKNFEKDFTHTTEPGRTSTRRLLGLLDKFK